MPKKKKKTKNLSPTQAIEDMAIKLVEDEKKNWENGQVYITEKVMFTPRDLIRQLRKNYWGVYDNPVDPLTGNDRIWPPLTESIIEGILKNIDLDTKDLNLRAKHADAVGLTTLSRSYVRNELELAGFGETLDMSERTMCIDGTFVWHTSENFGAEENESKVNIRIVDLLNCYIDPSARSIQEAKRFTERIPMFPADLESMATAEDWINTKDIKGSETLHKTDDQLASTEKTGPFQDVYESYGLYPKYLLTGADEDKDKEARLRVVVSGLETDDKRVHLIESYKGFKPWEEAWYSRVPNRWGGKGPAEKLNMLQWYMNMIINMRINRASVSQLGLFKIKKGSGITPQMLKGLASQGSVEVNSMEDIQEFALQGISGDSYKDEENIWQMAQRVTSAFEVAIGEDLPASTTATANVIQNRNAQSQFVLIKKATGMFLERWASRHLMPILQKRLKNGDIVRITGDADELREIDERVANNLVYEKLLEMTNAGEIVDEQDVERERQRAIEQLSSLGEDRWVEMLKDGDLTKYDVKFYVTNEEFDKGVVSKDLIAAINVAPEFREVLLKQVFDLVGIDSFQIDRVSRKLKSQANSGQVAQPLPAGNAQLPAGDQNPVEEAVTDTTNANVL